MRNRFVSRRRDTAGQIPGWMDGLFFHAADFITASAGGHVARIGRARTLNVDASLVYVTQPATEFNNGLRMRFDDRASWGAAVLRPYTEKATRDMRATLALTYLKSMKMFQVCNWPAGQFARRTMDGMTETRRHSYS
jgi:hypothetical protein